MASLAEQFQHYYIPDDAAVEEAILTGLIVPDTNVLLSLYRFQTEARENLFDALEIAEGRLWIPHQVGYEFHERRLDVMRDQESYFARTQEDLDKLIDQVQGRARNFRARIALNEDSLKEIEEGIACLRDLVAKAVKKAETANEVRLSGHASDHILARVLGMFPDGRVGDPMPPDELGRARKEATRRVEEKIPPGYKDAKKTDASGDYLLWRQLLKKAKERKIPVVLVTDDRKEDWYWIYGGQVLGARRELRREMMAEADVPLLIMTTETFLRHADAYLGVPLRPETVNQVSSQQPAGESDRPYPDIVYSDIYSDGTAVPRDALMLLADALQRSGQFFSRSSRSGLSPGHSGSGGRPEPDESWQEFIRDSIDQQMERLAADPDTPFADGAREAAAGRAIMAIFARRPDLPAHEAKSAIRAVRRAFGLSETPGIDDTS